MFSLPHQTLNDLQYDLDEVYRLNINQVTTYPLFTFPYTTIGRYKEIKKLKMPNLIKRRRMYKKIHSCLISQDFRRTSVWNFTKADALRYSSVTRNYYIGLGAGGASSFKNVFYFNTFSVHEYIKSLLQNKTPIAFSMEISSQLNALYKLYWKLYDTCIEKTQLDALSKENPRIKKILQVFDSFGFLNKSNSSINLTERGAFWVHLLQNYFVLNYINTVWSKAMRMPWPEEIVI